MPDDSRVVPLMWDGEPVFWDGDPLSVDPDEWDAMELELMARLAAKS